MEYHVFGKRSTKVIGTLHADMQLILRESLKLSQVDFGASEGHRPIERQKWLYASGRTRPGPILTKIDGVEKTGKHNIQPSPAVDIYIYVKGQPTMTFNKYYLIYVGGVITSVAQRLYNEGKISHVVRWGYNWDSDGEIATDQTFQDLPHHELKKP